MIIGIPVLLNWAFFDANFTGTSKEDCTGNGACWVFINVWFDRLIYGLYPNDQIWRVNVAFIILILTVGAAFFVHQKIKKYIIIFLLFIFPFILISLLSGGNFGLEKIPTNEWGGLALTFIISIFAILFCFPVGMFLALGRRSSFPVIRYSSIGFIEFWRVLNYSFICKYFNVFTDGTFLDKLIRVIIAITLFEAAYMAEVKRVSNSSKRSV